jgi:protease IV
MAYLSALMRFFRGLWRGLDGLRKVLHLLFLLVFFVLVLSVLMPEPPQVPRAAALRIAPQGALVDQLSGDPVQRALARAQGLPFAETLLQDLVDAIRWARDDDRIRVLVLELDRMESAGLSKLEELAAAIVDFRDSGKPVVAVGDGFSRNQYYLAAHADHVYMHPMGFVLIDGYGQYTPYYKSLLDRLYVDYNVWTAGEYKSYVEPVTRDDMSDEDREAREAYLGGLWEEYQRSVTTVRGLAGDALQYYADNAAGLLAATAGDAGRLALEQELVDELLARDEMRERIRELVDADHSADSYPQVSHGDYLRALRASGSLSRRGTGTDKVALVHAVGEILDGSQPPGSVGGDSTARLIRSATKDDDVKALVLRVDSPGGSAFASEVILRELQAFQETGRPLVVSMGSVAASGGYWISMAADQIWASPSTLTGSIGVGATMPTFQRSLEAIGVHVDGVGTTELSGLFDVTRELSDSGRELIGQSISWLYREFMDKVATHRNMPLEAVEVAARGRVWTGAQAHQLGLVDELGHLEDAIRAAAGLAGLEEDRYRVESFAAPLGFAERMAMEMIRLGAPVIGALQIEFPLSRSLQALLAATQEPLEFARRFNDPRGIYAYCFCDVR